jgi:hypothetical protein
MKSCRVDDEFGEGLRWLRLNEKQNGDENGRGCSGGDPGNPPRPREAKLEMGREGKLQRAETFPELFPRVDLSLARRTFRQMRGGFLFTIHPAI